MTSSDRRLYLAALVSGVLGFLLFVATPFMPVEQTQSTVSWPQQDSLASVNAPLISYSPDRMEVSVPLAATRDMREGQNLILSTVPEDSEDALERGLFLRTDGGGISIAMHGESPFFLDKKTLDKAPDDAVLHLVLDDQGASVSLSHTDYAEIYDEDVRPQVTGIYTELDDAPGAAAALMKAGLKVTVDVNSRFTSSPSSVKYASMGLGILALVISLVCLGRIDRRAGVQARRLFAPEWYRPRLTDWVVTVVLLFWHVFGANTSDDGFLLTMARASRHSTYMANYYRWYGVPESPFGAPYYDLLGLMSQVSTASIWMRLPALISAFAVWILLSRAVLPRLGEVISQRRTAQWTAALMFLAFWLPYNNGTRPEPIIALGALLTWVLFERAIATTRLLPAAFALIIATISLGAGPTGLMAVASVIVALPSLIKILYARLPKLGASPITATKSTVVGVVAAQLAPFLAAGTAILIAVFGDQTLATVRESIRVRAETGPALNWYEEWARFQSLLEESADGSVTRRFAVLLMFVCLSLVIANFVRRGSIPGAHTGPSLRLVFVVFGTMFFMMFTPTKWTHHFGVYAGIAGGLAALAAVALAGVLARSVRARIFAAAGLLFVLAISLAGTNGWWYVSSYGIPWWDKPVQYKAIHASTVVLGITLLVLLYGVSRYFRKTVDDAREELPSATPTASPRRSRRIPGFTLMTHSPLAATALIMVLFSIASLGKGFVSQYPAYSIGLGNLRSLAGNSCELASDVLVETNSNDSFLTPINGPLATSLHDGGDTGFSSENIPDTISSEAEHSTEPGALADSLGDKKEPSSGQDTGTTGGNRPDAGINGATATLPFNLDYRKVPVTGSWRSGSNQTAARVTTEWYQLPTERRDDAPLIVVSAAGKIEHHDINGVKQKGQKLVLEYGVRGADGTVTKKGSSEMLETGPKKAWRNLRLPLDSLPDGVNVVRIKAEDINLAQKEWIAFTPPRVPTLEPLTQRIDPATPGLLDWSVALQFPCERTFNHYAGVTEIPEFRISPDYDGKVTLSNFQNYEGGGIMSIAQALSSSYELPAYLRDDWQRDWGSIEIYEKRTNSVGEAPRTAEVTHTVITRSGWWSPGKMMLTGEAS